MDSLAPLAFILCLGSAPALEEPSPQLVVAPKPAVQLKPVADREAERRAAVAEQQRRNADFVRQCRKPSLTDRELADCRVAYRKLWLE